MYLTVCAQQQPVLFVALWETSDSAALLRERQVRLDPRFVSFVDACHLAELTFALGVFRRHQMASRRLRTQNFAASGDFEPFRDRFASFAARN
jgi:hypothetical protein